MSRTNGYSSNAWNEHFNCKVLDAHVVDGFAYEGPEQEPVGLICEIDEISTEALQKASQNLFHIPYTDFEGKQHDSIKKLQLLQDVVMSCLS